MTSLPDLIIMDVNMPNMNGIEATRIICSHPMTDDIPITMFTTTSEQSAVVEALSAGAKDYLIKTDDKNSIQERIETNFFKD